MKHVIKSILFATVVLCAIMLTGSACYCKPNAKFNAALFQAIRKGSLNTVKSLIKKGADINARDNLDDTPLYLAVIMERPEVVRLLVKAGADPNAKDDVDGTPLMSAVSDKSVPMVKALLDCGANPNYVHSLFGTVLLYAIEKSTQPIIDLLIAHGASLSGTNPLGETALMIAARKGNSPLVEYLLQHNANPSQKSMNGETASSLAIKNNHYHIATLIGMAVQKPLDIVRDTDAISTIDGVRYLTGTVSNNTNNIYKYVEVNVIFFDNAGAQVDSGMTNTANLAAQGLWQFRILILREDATSYKIVSVTGDK